MWPNTVRGREKQGKLIKGKGGSKIWGGANSEEKVAWELLFSLCHNMLPS